MTFYATWPNPNGPNHYHPHETETQAEAHAAEIVRSGKASVATYFEIDALESSA